MNECAFQVYQTTAYLFHEKMLPIQVLHCIIFPKYKNSVFNMFIQWRALSFKITSVTEAQIYLQIRICDDCHKHPALRAVISIHFLSVHMHLFVICRCTSTQSPVVAFSCISKICRWLKHEHYFREKFMNGWCHKRSYAIKQLP